MSNKENKYIFYFLLYYLMCTAYGWGQNVIPNAGFEVWTPADTQSSWLFPSFWEQNHKKTLRSTESWQGLYSISISGDSKNPDSVYTRMGFKGKPESVKGYVKSSPPLTLCQFYIRLEGNDSFGNPILVAEGSGMIGSNQNQWENWRIPLIYLSEIPVVRARISLSTDPRSQDSTKMVYVDQLSFSSGLISNELTQLQSPFLFYPNPGDGLIYHNLEENFNYSIINPFGKFIQIGQLMPKKPILIENIPNGIYQIVIEGNITRTYKYILNR